MWLLCGCGHSCVLFISYLCCMKALKWNVFTDASARRLAVGQGEPLCEPWVSSYSINCKIFFVKTFGHRKVSHVLDCLGIFKNITYCWFSSSLCWSGSWLSCQGACGHLQRKKEVRVSDTEFFLFACQIYKSNRFRDTLKLWSFRFSIWLLIYNETTTVGLFTCTETKSTVTEMVTVHAEHK